MAEISSNGKVRVHIWLDQDILDEIDELYGSRFGRSNAIRVILKKYIGLLRAKVAEKAQPIGGINVEL